MNYKKIAFSSISILLIGTLTSGVMVKADDDEHEHEEKYEKYRENDDDWYEYEEDEDEYRYEYNYGNSTEPIISQQDTWNIWTRTIMVQKGNLPFNDPKNISLQVEDEKKERTFYIIPRDGELFVPGKGLAESLGAKATIHKTSQILEITGNDTEMILRANTNVAYDNNMKTPIPSVAFYMNHDIYIPISVITNGLGYSVEWQEENNTIVCRKFTSK